MYAGFTVRLSWRSWACGCFPNPLPFPSAEERECSAVPQVAVGGTLSHLPPAELGPREGCVLEQLS